jgi:hypothetical protein
VSTRNPDLAANVLLSGVVGSTAYGLACEGSDIDRLGLFAAPTVQFHGLGRPAESHVTTKPDSTLHEAGKFVRLALDGNPTVSELMWLTSYETVTPLGEQLVAIRSAFLSAPRARDAYLQYAKQQLTKLVNRSTRAGADTRGRAEKNARHIARLVEQGEHLYVTGELLVRLPDPERTRAMGRFLVDDPRRGFLLIEAAEHRMDAKGTVLPQRPDEAIAEDWLRAVRASFYAPIQQRSPSGLRRGPL